MSNKNTKKEVIVIDDGLISNAIDAIESTEPTVEEREAMQLAKLIPSIRKAMDRGDSEEAIRKKLKTTIPGLHYSKVDKLFKDAKASTSEPNEQVTGGDQ